MNRPGGKMKWRTGVIVVWILILAYLGVFSLVPREVDPNRVLPATVDRDCAPWDGSAFMITIPDSSGNIIISIWREPELRTASRFQFPDTTGMRGSVMLHTRDDRWVELRGTVTLRSAILGQPVRGWLNLAGEAGWRGQGQFRAEWEVLAVYCA